MTATDAARLRHSLTEPCTQGSTTAVGQVLRGALPGPDAAALDELSGTLCSAGLHRAIPVGESGNTLPYKTAGQ